MAIQKGERRSEDESLFRSRTTDPGIEPDRVSAPIAGYFRIPAVWVGTAPDPRTVRALNRGIHHAFVISRKLKCGIEARARRDGTFLFDFSTWPIAPIVLVPGYRIPNPKEGHLPPSETAMADVRAAKYVVLRSQVMNVHQVCLTTAEMVVKGRSAMMGYPITATNTLQALTFEGATPYHDDVEDVHALAHNVLNNTYPIQREKPLPRRALEVDVVEHSFDLLDEILLKEQVALIDIIEAAYIAVSRWREGRFGEAVTLAWAVCEQLLASLWKGLLEDLKGAGSSSRLPTERMRKFASRDYTASIITETLELTGRIDETLYRHLEIARKARNKWVHDMRVPRDGEAQVAIRSVQLLLKQSAGINIDFVFAGRAPGGGIWPRWMWEEIKARGSS